MKSTYSLYQVDAFTNRRYGGNPACVIFFDHDWLPDKYLRQIAAENAVAETAFIKMSQDGYYIRWFTPEIEMDLCGHATLAAAHVLIHHLKKDNQITFHSESGVIRVNGTGNKLYQLDLPIRRGIPTDLPKVIRASLSIQPIAVFRSRDYLLIYPNEQEVLDLKVDSRILNLINLDPGGIIVSAPGIEVDFVSRFFTPQASIFEDPVTGSAHCTLVPYWAEVLGKKKLKAKQLSEREGTLFCELGPTRVYISGRAVTFYSGSIYI